MTTKGCLERLVIAGTPSSVTDEILALGNGIGGFGRLPFTDHNRANRVLA